MIRVVISPNSAGAPAGKVADAELHFIAEPYAPHTTDPEPLAGLKLIGFSIWERRGGNGYNVTFPARSYSVNGERRSFALLRPSDSATPASYNAQDRVRDLILQAYDQHQQTQREVAAAQRRYADQQRVPQPQAPQPQAPPAAPASTRSTPAAPQVAPLDDWF